MRIDREKAYELRRSGKSYTQIKKELGVPLSTLSGWFKGVEWSNGLTQRLRETARKESLVRLERLNVARGERLQKAYRRAVEEARNEFQILRYNPLFVAGLILYMSRGAKEVRGQIRFGSADPGLIKLFTSFLMKVCHVPPEKIRAAVFIHPGLDTQTAVRFWALGTGIPLDGFVKTMVVPGKYDAREFTYGSCTVTVSSMYLKTKMLEWKNLLPGELIDTR